MSEHPVKWTSAAPLWKGVATATDEPTRRAFSSPNIMRFTTDSFMEDFLRIVERDPTQLAGHLARPERWSRPALPPSSEELLKPSARTSALARRLERLRVSTERLKAAAANKTLDDFRAANNSATGKPAEDPLKLFQPAHQRYYLVTACLVCQITGLPDRSLDSGRQERAFYVLRRLLPPDHQSDSPLPPFVWDEDPVKRNNDPKSWREYAHIVTPRGSQWRKLGDQSESALQTLVPGEEELPLFPVNYAEDDGRRRRLLAGVIPVGKRESLLGDELLSQEPPVSATRVSPSDPRMIELYNTVTEPWKRVIEKARAAVKVKESVTGSDPAPKPADIANFFKVTREQVQHSSWYILLDFARFIEKNELANSLDATLSSIFYKTGKSLKSAMAEILQNYADALEREDRSYVEGATGWPPANFAFADAEQSLATTPNGNSPLNTDAEAQAALARVDGLAEEIRLLLPAAADVAPPPLVAQKPLEPRQGWFVIRCVFDRPNCGPLEPPVVSAPSVPFQMAGFFDPDAPARPIRIALPIDTTPAGLRKFDKNTAFMISDVLCGQIKRAQGLTFGDLALSVLPWPFHKDLPSGSGASCGVDAGMMCSLSIPIITICALILLIIIVSLLDIIFRWVPFFILCFRLPGFKAKQS